MKTTQEFLAGAINLANAEDVARIIHDAPDAALTDLAQKLTQLHDVICGTINLMLDELERRHLPLPAPAPVFPVKITADQAIEIHVPDNGKIH